jgi:hypothetical protein
MSEMNNDFKRLIDAILALDFPESDSGGNEIDDALDLARQLKKKYEELFHGTSNSQ